MKVYQYTAFTQQKRSADDQMQALVDQGIAALRARANVVGLTTINSVQRLASIFNSVDLGLNHWARLQTVYELVMGAGPYRIYFFYTPGNDTCSLMALAKENGTGIREYFGSWKLDHLPEDSTRAFAGTWDPQGVNNVVNMNSTAALTDDHNNKHFGGAGPAQYTIGTGNTRKHIVAGMEQTAVDWGILLPGEAFFLFDRNVGTDGIGGGGGSASMAIRVDTPGANTQHSHPVPAESCQSPNQTDKFYAALESCCRHRDIAGFVRLAKYCRVIGAGPGVFRIGQNRKAAFGAGDAQIRPPVCVYWPWA